MPWRAPTTTAAGPLRATGRHRACCGHPARARAWPEPALRPAKGWPCYREAERLSALQYLLASSSALHASLGLSGILYRFEK